MVGIQSSVTSQCEYQWVCACVCFMCKKTYKFDSILLALLILILLLHESKWSMTRSQPQQMMDFQSSQGTPHVSCLCVPSLLCCRVGGLRAITWKCGTSSLATLNLVVSPWSFHLRQQDMLTNGRHLKVLQSPYSREWKINMEISCVGHSNCLVGVKIMWRI